MEILLVQHGKCFDKEKDPERGLSPEGRLEVAQIAEKASEAGVSVSSVYHSGKLRAQQTAEVFAERLNANRIESISGINPKDSVEEFAASFQWRDKSMLVGHLPFMERFASYLIMGQPEPVIIKFQNAGIVCLEKKEDDYWYVKWTMMPVLD